MPPDGSGSVRETEAVYRRYAIVSEADLHEGIAKLTAMNGNGYTVPVATTTGRVVKLAKTAM